MDGYDKIEVRICHTGAIDGYSRTILWLRVSDTNNDPKVIVSYFVEFASAQNITPRVIRSDRSSENVNVCGIQRYFRRNQFDNSSGEKNFRYEPSTSNQRIESWWSCLKRSYELVDKLF